MSSRKSKSLIVKGYAKMWPRTIFDIKEKNKLLNELRELLHEPGVYVLYRDDQPYYVGQASGRLFNRIWAHANRPKDKYYNFWNYFSAFVVPEKKYLSEIEGLLIASMPTENSSVHRINKIHIPTKIAKFIRSQRIIHIDEA